MKMSTRKLGLVAGLAFAACEPGAMHGDDFGFPDGMMTPTDNRVVVRAQEAPPPISGGTLLVSRDQRTAIVADPDHDLIWRVHLGGALGGPNAGPILSATALEAGDEPGRVVEDVRGLIHVALRRGGAIATIDPARAQEVTRRAVCPEPRGLAYDDEADVLLVACTNGELVTLPAAGGAELRRVQLDGDLRDVVIRRNEMGNTVFVSRFRSAELLQLSSDGSMTYRYRLPVTETMSFTENGESIVSFAPGTAWRTLALPDGSIEMIHQRGKTGESTVSVVEPGGYGGGGFDGCTPGIVQSASSRLYLDDGGLETSPFYRNVVLPVDVAVSESGDEVAIVSAGTRSVVVQRRDAVDGGGDDGCSGMEPRDEYPLSIVDERFMDETHGNQPVAVTYRRADAGNEEILVQVRDPAAIVNLTTRIVTMLPAPAVSDSGHQTFHEAASVTGGDFSGLGAPLACASCHPEGREDGRTWNFAEIGPRRTQSVAGGILGTEPFHWDGDMTHFDTLMTDVFVGRMAGARPSTARMSAISSWLDTIPAPRIGLPVDADAAERGRTLFEDQDVGCTSCHTGTKYTNNRTVDVGTGGEFQVPSLVGVSARSPYLHDGRAMTLRDRFDATGGGDRHGVTSHLDREQIDDLVAFLDTL